MDQPVRKQAADIIGKSKVAVSAINFKFAALKLPPAATPTQSVGSLLAMAITAGKTHTADSIILEAAQIRRNAKRQIAECEKKLAELKDGSNLWFQLSDFLTSKQAVLPTTVPEYLARAANLVRSAALTGAIPASTLQTLSEEVKRNAMTSLSYLSDTEKKLARISSAGMVASAVQADAFFSRIKHHQGFTEKDQQRLKRYAPIVAKVASERRIKHAEAHFQPHEFKRVYKSFETSGVEL